MSKYLTVETVMNDVECLKETLKELGYPFEEHTEAQHLYGYQGDKRKQKAHIIINRKNVGGAANDVGFLKNADGNYEMLISEYDQHAGSQSSRSRDGEMVLVEHSGISYICQRNEG